MICREIIHGLELLAPSKYAESWDNIGLLVGREDTQVNKIMIALDATEDVIDQCVAKKVDLLVTHHPVLFAPVKRINWKDVVGRKMIKLIKNDINCYAMHTNFDVTVMAKEAARRLEISNPRTLQKTYEDAYYKFVVYTPVDSVDKVRRALTKDGAGHIGNYSECSFGAEGIGTFKPLEGTSPYIGKEGELTTTKEVRLETIVPKEKLKGTLQSVLRVHPYEEVAYDIYPLENTTSEEGIGCYGYLNMDTTLEALAEKVKEIFKLEHVQVYGALNQKVACVAVSPGAGKSLVKHTYFKNIDVLITGDIDHHTALDALERGICIIDAGHFGTEHFGVEYIKEYLEKYCKESDHKYVATDEEIEIMVAAENNPVQIV